MFTTVNTHTHTHCCCAQCLCTDKCVWIHPECNENDAVWLYRFNFLWKLIVFKWEMKSNCISTRDTLSSVRNKSKWKKSKLYTNILKVNLHLYTHVCIYANFHVWNLSSARTVVHFFVLLFLKIRLSLFDLFGCCFFFHCLIKHLEFFEVRNVYLTLLFQFHAFSFISSLTFLWSSNSLLRPGMTTHCCCCCNLFSLIL